MHIQDSLLNKTNICIRRFQWTQLPKANTLHIRENQLNFLFFSKTESILLIFSISRMWRVQKMQKRVYRRRWKCKRGRVSTHGLHIIFWVLWIFYFGFLMVNFIYWKGCNWMATCWWLGSSLELWWFFGQWIFRYNSSTLYWCW